MNKPSCCHHEPPQKHDHHGASCHVGAKPKFDWLLWGSIAVIVLGYLIQWLAVSR